jgi:hypothetical protein
MYAGVGPGSFYVRAPDPVVWNSTGARKNQTIKMYTFMLRDVFVWHPAAIFQGDGYPACPKCKTKLPSLVQYHGWGDYREVVCKSTCIQLITTRYKCFNYGCTAGTFHAYDSDVLSQYPAYIKHAFPFFLTHRKAIDRELLQEISDARASGQSMSDFRRRIIGLHKDSHFKRETQYYSLAGAKWEKNIYDSTPPKFFEWEEGGEEMEDVRGISWRGLSISEKFLIAL